MHRDFGQAERLGRGQAQVADHDHVGGVDHDGLAEAVFLCRGGQSRNRPCAPFACIFFEPDGAVDGPGLDGQVRGRRGRRVALLF